MGLHAFARHCAAMASMRLFVIVLPWASSRLLVLFDLSSQLLVLLDLDFVPLRDKWGKSSRSVSLASLHAFLLCLCCVFSWLDPRLSVSFPLSLLVLYRSEPGGVSARLGRV